MASSGPSGMLRFGKYQLYERLGRGGMAEVWKAKIVGPAGFERTLVVKRILPHLAEDSRFIQMFVSEARLSARLTHPNVVQVFELGDVNGEFFLAMEYVRGKDLVAVVRSLLGRGLPPPALGAYVVREVCRALAYAHGLTDDAGQPLRLIHRDVSPSNVMISFDGMVKLLDFGIAKALAESTENKTQTGTLKGKFGYMSPEQIDGKEIDHRADLYAVGIVLHEVLTGRRLFKGGNDLQTIAMVREGRIEPPSALNDQVPPELDRICLKALARDRDARYAGCHEMAADLDEVVHHLKWSPEKMAELMRELFAADDVQTGPIPLLPEEASASGSSLTIGALRAQERRRKVAFAAGGLALLGGVAWLVAARVGSSRDAAALAGLSASGFPSPQPSGKERVPSSLAAPSTAGAARTGAAVDVEIATQDAAGRPLAEAMVYFDGSYIGLTPKRHRVEPLPDHPVVIKVAKTGYEEWTLTVEPKDLGQPVMAVLKAAPDLPDSSKGGRTSSSDHGASSSRSTRRPSPEDKTGEDRPARPGIKEGGVVDPFAN